MIYGIYKVKMAGVNSVYLYLQHNCICPKPENQMMQIFDLKGSMFNRQVLSTEVLLSHESSTFTTLFSVDALSNNIYSELPEELKKALIKNSNTLKDVDFLQLSKNYPKLFRVTLPEADSKLVNQLIEKDSEFFRNNNIMDYSVLLGIEKVTDRGSFGINPPTGTDSSSEKMPSRQSFMSHDGNYIYHISIIDYLQTYSLSKRSELILKTVFWNAKPEELSSIPPDKYQ